MFWECLRQYEVFGRFYTYIHTILVFWFVCKNWPEIHRQHSEKHSVEKEIKELIAIGQEVFLTQLFLGSAGSRSWSDGVSRSSVLAGFKRMADWYWLIRRRIFFSGLSWYIMICIYYIYIYIAYLGHNPVSKPVQWNDVSGFKHCLLGVSASDWDDFGSEVKPQSLRYCWTWPRWTSIL